MKTGRSVSLVFAVAILSAFAAFAEGLDDNLVARYDFTSIEAGGKVSDLSGNGRTLTVGAGCSLTNGPFGAGALYFNGTDGKDIGSFATFSCPALESRTISFWVNFEDFSDLANNAYLIRNLNGLVVSVNKDTLAGSVASGLSGSVKYVAGKTQNILYLGEIGSWHHYTLVWEVVSKTAEDFVVVFREYRDGVLVSTSDETTVPAAKFVEATETATFGNTSASNKSYPIRGSMASIRVYSAAASATQAFELYKTERSSDMKRLVAYWPMDEIVAGEDGVKRTPNRAPQGAFSDLVLGEGVTSALSGGQVGGALAWDSTADSFAVATNRVPVGLADWTFSAWVWTQGVTASNSTPTVFLTGNGTQLTHDKGVRKTVAETLGYGREDECKIATTEGLFARGTWTHLVSTHAFSVSESGTPICTVTLYRNGEVAGTTVTDPGETPCAVTECLFAAGMTLALGNTLDENGAGGAHAFGGRLDEVCVFAGALTAAEVAVLYAGADPVDAGCDFATATEKAVLRGELFRHVGGIAVPKVGDCVWALVSAPVGGEGATILSAGSPVTEVTLPVAGSYVFRLTSGALTATRSDTVSVTRLAPSVGNQPPVVSTDASGAVTRSAPLTLVATASDPDAGPGPLRTYWTKVSGPGAVWFETLCDGRVHAAFSAAGEYVIRCHAEDGQDAAFADKTVTVSDMETQLETDLLHHWNVSSDGKVVDAVSATENSLNTTTKRADGGVAGYGIRFDSFADPLDTSTTLEETPSISGTGNSRPIESQRRKTFSAWAWVDSADTNDCRGGVVVGVYQSFGIRYDEPGNPGAFSIYQEGDKTSTEEPYEYSGIGNAIQYFALPAGYDPIGRWTHLVAVVDRWGVDDQQLWVNGEKMVKTGSTKTANRAGRPTGNVWIGGMKRVTNQDGKDNGYLTDADGKVLSRTFPGVVDDVRIWNRTLTDDEIRYLAANPAVQNRAPQSETPSVSSVETIRKAEATLPTVTAYDDGLPEGFELAGDWIVVEGDASAVTIDGDHLIATKKGVYKLVRRVSDGERSGFSEPVTVTVTSPGMVLLLR